MIQDAVMAGLLPEQPLVTRLAAVGEAATTANLEAHDDEDKATAKVYSRKAAQAADEAWQQTVQGHNGPTVTNPTVSEIEHSSSASQDVDDDVEIVPAPPRKSRLGVSQLQAQLSQLSDRTQLTRPKNTLYSEGAGQQVTRIEDLCQTHDSYKSTTWTRVREVS